MQYDSVLPRRDRKYEIQKNEWGSVSLPTKNNCLKKNRITSVELQELRRLAPIDLASSCARCEPCIDESPGVAGCGDDEPVM
jgi:hypothetical protein